MCLHRQPRRTVSEIMAARELLALAEGGTVLFVSIERVSNSTVPPSASAILSGGARSLSVKFKHVVKPSSTRSMAERKGELYADK